MGSLDFESSHHLNNNSDTSVVVDVFVFDTDKIVVVSRSVAQKVLWKASSMSSLRELSGCGSVNPLAEKRGTP